jgi:peptidylprolyl isomerase/FKBP-type peptidyl-prolyl cis-trans isomerase FklB
LQQAYQGKPLALKDEQIEQILNEHEAQVAMQHLSRKANWRCKKNSVFSPMKKPGRVFANWRMAYC